MILGLIILEVVGLILLGRVFGLFVSIIWIIITFFLGLVIFKSALNSNFSNLLQGSIKKDDEVNYYLSLGGLALMLPGLLSDIIGFALVIYAFFLSMTSKFSGKKRTNKPKEKRDSVIDITDYEERK